MTSRRERLEKVIVSPLVPLSDAIEVLDRAGLGILLLCDEHQSLRGVLTDGDIRRAIIRHQSLDVACVNVASTSPVTIKPGAATASEAMAAMDGGAFQINHLPVVDEEGRVVDLIMRRDLISEETLGLSAVIMAGGFGTRLRPLTQNTPKPMLPIGGRPLLEHTIEHLRNAGIRHVNVATHFQAETIKDHFGNGDAFGMDIQYVTENEPLGTAGSLRLLKPPDTPMLVVNGDVMTRVNYRAMLDYHTKHNAGMTIGVKKYDVEVPYGVISCDGERVVGLEEKPRVEFFVNAGIYLLAPRVFEFLPADKQTFHMTDFAQTLIDKQEVVVSFPIMEYWLDIGQHEDYLQAQKDYDHVQD